MAFLGGPGNSTRKGDDRMKPIAIRAGLAVCIGLLIATMATVALAEPKQGFGLFGGTASHERSSGGTSLLGSSGLSIGVDYQIPISEFVSFNPFLESSAESVESCDGCTAGHGILGLQLRVWLGDVFIGGHVGNYSEVITIDTGFGTFDFTGSGTGAGAVIGWEGSDGGLFLALQVDSATISYDFAADTDLTSTRLHIGYRWK